MRDRIGDGQARRAGATAPNADAIPRALAEEPKSWMLRTERQLLFPGPGGGSLSNNTLNRWYRELCREAGVREISSHGGAAHLRVELHGHGSKPEGDRRAPRARRHQRDREVHARAGGGDGADCGGSVECDHRLDRMESRSLVQPFWRAATCAAAALNVPAFSSFRSVRAGAL